MKFFRRKIGSISLILALLSLNLPVSSLETDILMMTGHNLSMNLGPEFVLSKDITSEEGMLFQRITINNSEDSDVNASLLLWSLPMYRDDLKRTNSSEFSKFWENNQIGVFQLAGGEVVSESIIKDAWQRNVTAYYISTPKSKEKPAGEELIFAAWPIDSRNLVMLISYLDQNVTAKIIETLEVKS